jgi:hypothetical protein
MKFLVLDTELGGPNFEEYSLLTVCLKVYEGESPKTSQYVDKLNLTIKRKDYKISFEGMEVNKLDLKKINEFGVTVKEARAQLATFIFKHGGKKSDRLIVVGQGVSGDIKAILNELMSPSTWYDYVDRLVIDTLSLATAVRTFGGFKLDQSLKLKDLCDLAGLGPYNFHDAEGDVDATWGLLVWLQNKLPINLIQEKSAG